MRAGGEGLGAIAEPAGGIGMGGGFVRAWKLAQETNLARWQSAKNGQHLHYLLG